jgi:hypothetical protein
MPLKGSGSVPFIKRPTLVALFMLGLLAGCDREQQQNGALGARDSVPATTITTMTATTATMIARTPV